ncbi:hypothetical protein MELA_02293 [Candidatus Methylomirabilis lanthanidiphila]|uniref:Uncharacterized protein n=1 Tax=Candidatus Methylomirabilis lanthanidiphila TaxID=2211376 RepID=A0A564ZLC9_9BACT|nr:hypothetical protein MELA_02293 [Candidatus Methylomirabilis lanthanidiphila]
MSWLSNHSLLPSAALFGWTVEAAAERLRYPHNDLLGGLTG